MPRRRQVNAADLARFQQIEEISSKINEIERALNSHKRVEIIEPGPQDSAEVRDAEIFIENRSFVKIKRFR